MKCRLCIKHHTSRFRFKVLNATFNNISVISWRSVLLVEETGVLGEKQSFLNLTQIFIRNSYTPHLASIRLLFARYHTETNSGRTHRRQQLLQRRVGGQLEGLKKGNLSCIQNSGLHGKEQLRNKSWKPEYVLSFNMGWQI